jgi:acyl phosphate:glycerol-3-phosphate acyltransferase
MIELIYIVLAYLLGSIPTAVWIGKLKYGVDVREHGSKNAGATNTFRVLGKKAGKVVLLIDVMKGATAVLLPYIFGYAPWSTPELIHLQLITGIIAVVGHIFPIFANFKGGKGVATSLGIIIGIHPIAAVICLGIFLLTFIFSQYVSLGAIVAATSFPLIVNLLLDNKNVFLMVFSIALSLAVIAAHRKNITRLLAGEENKMNLFKK